MTTQMSLPRENVQHYPRPPVLEPICNRIEVRLGGQTIAETTGALRVLETHHAPTYYLPPSDIVAELRPAPGRTLCEWKGWADYFDVKMGAVTAQRGAWCYRSPTPSFRALAGYVAFYPGLMDGCFVDDVRADPQPGHFYGGWVTPNLEGVPKGARGNEHW